MKIKVGDYVRITNPQEFVRCGYPMSKDIAVHHVKFNYQPLIKSVVDTFSDTSAVRRVFDDNDVQPLINAMAMLYMKSQGFGGRTRSIYKKWNKELVDAHALVVGKRFVTTGQYVPGAKYDTAETCEYDPPYLSDQKRHSVLSVKLYAYTTVGGVYEFCTHLGEIEICEADVMPISEINTSD